MTVYVNGRPGYLESCINQLPPQKLEGIFNYFKIKQSKIKKMRTITLENGKELKISEENYRALEGAVKEVTWDEIYADYIKKPFFSENSANLKTLAIKKLLITAKYLNGDWKPDWDDRQEQKWSVGINEYDDIARTWTFSNNDSFVYFKSETLTKRAISILGEEVIRTALNTNY